MPGARTCHSLSEARRQLAGLLSRVLLDADVTHEELAAAIGCSRHLVDQWCDRRNADKSITVAHLFLSEIPDSVVIPLIRLALAARGYAPPAKRDQAAAVEDDLRALSRLADAAGRATAEYAAALPDGLTPEEARSVIARIEALEDQLAAIKGRMADALPLGDSVRISDSPAVRMVGADRGRG